MDIKKASPVVGIVTTVLSVLLLVGVQTFAGPCGVHDDGSVSSCFWAARAVLGVSVVLVVLSVVRIVARDDGERRGLSLAIASLGALAACMPATLIDLCMMETMRCHTIMSPFVSVVGALITVVAAADVIMRLIALRKSR